MNNCVVDAWRIVQDWVVVVVEGAQIWASAPVQRAQGGVKADRNGDGQLSEGLDRMVWSGSKLRRRLYTGQSLERYSWSLYVRLGGSGASKPPFPQLRPAKRYTAVI